MTVKKFYSSRVDEEISQKLDDAYKKNQEKLRQIVDSGTWTSHQKSIQKRFILPEIALYQTFRQLGFDEDAAKELLRAYAYNSVKKINKVLKICFRIPKFSKVFRKIMRKQLTSTDIWMNKIIEDKDRFFYFDMTTCLWKDTCDYFECPNICEVFCSSDGVLYEGISKMAFHRTETLGTDGEKCDFRFTFFK